MSTSRYPVHTIESAPEKSKPALQGLKQKLGIVPNLAATMAESPVLIGSFVGVFGSLADGSFTNAERQVLLLTNAVTNRCSWAVAFHSTMALREGSRARTAEERSFCGTLEAPLVPVIPVRFQKSGSVFAFFSTVTTLGTPQDITLQEVRIECFFPADRETDERARRMATAN